MNDWKRVTKSKPCVVCKKPDWCTVGDSVACCMRIESDRPCANGGYLHRIAGVEPRRDFVPQPERLPKLIRWDLLLRQFVPKNGEIEHAAESLGVTADSLRRLGCGWDGESLTVPMRDSTGKVIGIRTRNPNGEKKAVAGSKEGLFFDPEIRFDTPILITEGVSDTAAAMSIGFSTIGRPSCRGGTASIQKMCERMEPNTGIVIVADNDKPGIMGANALAKEIKANVLVPPCKDLREWIVGNGATRETIIEAAR